MPSPVEPILRSKAAYPMAATNELLTSVTGGLNCLLYEQMAVDDSEPFGLPNIPDEALIAVIVMEADETTLQPDRIVRFTFDGQTTPTATIGMPLGDLSIYQAGGVRRWPLLSPNGVIATFSNCLDNFQCIGIEVGKTHTLHVQYFG